MTRLNPWWVVGGVGTFAALMTAGFLWMRSPGRGIQEQTPYRSYTATGQVVRVEALGSDGCTLQIKLHQWVSLNGNFTLAEIPQRGQLYTIKATPSQCLTLEVALASLADGDDPKDPRHVFYQATQLPSGEWHMSGYPSTPVDCGGL
jgi:hypothetical protein